jgi:hypothetical protein
VKRILFGGWEFEASAFKAKIGFDRLFPQAKRSSSETLYERSAPLTTQNASFLILGNIAHFRQGILFSER